MNYWRFYSCCSAHLVSVGVSADDDGFGPAGHQAWDVLTYDSFAEHGAAQDVADGSVGGTPHLLELELLHTLLIRRDGGALNAHVVTPHRLSRLHRHLVISGIAVLNAQVKAGTRDSASLLIITLKKH